MNFFETLRKKNKKTYEGKYPSMMSIQNFLVKELENGRKGPLYKAIPFTNKVNLIDSVVLNVAPLLEKSTIFGSLKSVRELSSFIFLMIRS